MLIKAGSTLLVPRDGQRMADVPEDVADNAAMLLAPDRPPGRRIAIRAGKSGSSVAAVARQYGVSADNVALWNGVSAGALFKAGQTIVVYRPARATSARTARAKPAVEAAPTRSAKAGTSTGRKAAAAAPARPVAGTKAKPPVRPVASSKGSGGSL